MLRRAEQTSGRVEVTTKKQEKGHKVSYEKPVVQQDVANVGKCYKASLERLQSCRSAKIVLDIMQGYVGCEEDEFTFSLLGEVSSKGKQE